MPIYCCECEYCDDSGGSHWAECIHTRHLKTFKPLEYYCPQEDITIMMKEYCSTQNTWNNCQNFKRKEPIIKGPSLWTRLKKVFKGEVSG